MAINATSFGEIAVYLRIDRRSGARYFALRAAQGDGWVSAHTDSTIARYRGGKLMDDEQTIRQARQLDPHTLAAIHDQFYPVVYRYARYRLQDEQICEDISGEVFLRLLNALDQGKGPTTNLRAWLIGTASHLVNDHLRERYRHPQDSLEELDVPLEASPETAAERISQQQLVQHAFHQLTLEQQHVLALRFSLEYSIEETAQTMGKTIGAVKTLQFRALAALRKWLLERQRL